MRAASGAGASTSGRQQVLAVCGQWYSNRGKKRTASTSGAQAACRPSWHRRCWPSSSRAPRVTNRVAAQDHTVQQDFDLATQQEDTIAAIVTGSVSQGAVSIIRVSGGEALQVARRVFRPGGRFRMGWSPRDRGIHYGNAVDSDERVLDEVLLLCMRAPRSYTCEDVVELHTHGGSVCVARVLQACVEAGARVARPGEFTLRAFLNGRLDLAQAEAVTALLEARTPAAADSALAGLRGGLGDLVARMREQTKAILAEVEARIDFDEDMPDMDAQRLQRQVDALQAGIEGALRTARQGNLLRRGLTAAIVGRPNVGKSSLLNAWTDTDRAIVTDIAGTTRDVLEAGLVVGGVPITLLDTAGIRDSVDVVERLGVERSRAAAAAADIVIMVVDAQAGWTPADSDIFQALWGDGPGTPKCAVRGLSLLVLNKTDLAQPGPNSQQATASGAAIGTGPAPRSDSNSSPSGGQPQHLGGSSHSPLPPSSSPASVSLPLVAREVFQATVATSAKWGAGITELNQAVLALAGAPQLASGGASWAVNERQAEALVRAHEALMKVVESMQAGLPMDFWTIDLRATLIALGEVSGDDVTEEVLDSVFSRFCIGK